MQGRTGGSSGRRAEGAFDAASRSALFDAVVNVFPHLSATEPHPFGAVEPAAFSFVHLDRDRAIPFLSDPIRWRVDDRPAFCALTRALVAAKAVLPGDRILAHLDSLEPLQRFTGSDEFPYGDLLRLLRAAATRGPASESKPTPSASLRRDSGPGSGSRSGCCAPRPPTRCSR